VARDSSLPPSDRRRRRIGRPPGHRVVLVFCLAVLMLVLLAHGVIIHATGRSETSAARTADAELPRHHPLLVADGKSLAPRPYRPGRRIALTFDDGPDPRWTPKIVATLERFRVPATFFVVGSNVARHPDVVRNLHRRGFELGNHTFTHSDLSRLPRWRRSGEIRLTETALAGVVGIRPRLVRPPYSSGPAAVTRRQVGALAEVARRGYVITLADFDGEDWQRPGVRSIVRAVTPRGNSGGIVLLHDGGGDRSQTVAALEQIIPRLKARGFRFVRVSDLAGLPQSAVELPAKSGAHLRGRLLIGALGLAQLVTAVLAMMLLLVGALTVLRAVLLFGLARRHVRVTKQRPTHPDFSPPVSIIVPAFNEAVGIERTVRALVASPYKYFEVIVVDDGSSDGTGDLVERLGLDRARVLRQENAGKAAALNRGLRAAAHDVIVTVDADTLFEGETLARLVEPFAAPRVGAVSGNTKVGNRRRLLGRWQHIEYVMGFNLDRRLYDVLQCMPTVPGSVGAFRRAALVEVGGISAATLAEDTDTTLAVGRAGWRVVYADEARGWTEAPASLGALWRQRYRWSYGTMQAVWKHKAAFWRRGEKRIGRRGLPYLVLFQIALPMLAPLVDLFAVYGLLFLNPLAVIAYWGGFNAVQLALALYAFRLDGESARTLWAMPLQQFVYRQLMYLVVIESIFTALLGARMRWHRAERTGEIEVAS
jgi:cellulose synthase/poly-beta-1,6-N-acetylglucosamine synthase-like glycosyltransferase/peptidoglycan/xylan/chitin deacetylase (PgdA/CDA1 family)